MCSSTLVDGCLVRRSLLLEMMGVYISYRGLTSLPPSIHVVGRLVLQAADALFSSAALCGVSLSAFGPSPRQIHAFQTL